MIEPLPRDPDPIPTYQDYLRLTRPRLEESFCKAVNQIAGLDAQWVVLRKAPRADRAHEHSWGDEHFGPRLVWAIRCLDISDRQGNPASPITVWKGIVEQRLAPNSEGAKYVGFLNTAADWNRRDAKNRIYLAHRHALLRLTDPAFDGELNP